MDMEVVWPVIFSVTMLTLIPVIALLVRRVRHLERQVCKVACPEFTYPPPEPSEGGRLCNMITALKELDLQSPCLADLQGMDNTPMEESLIQIATTMREWRMYVPELALHENSPVESEPSLEDPMFIPGQVELLGTSASGTTPAETPRMPRMAPSRSISSMRFSNIMKVNNASRLLSKVCRELTNGPQNNLPSARDGDSPATGSSCADPASPTGMVRLTSAPGGLTVQKAPVGLVGVDLGLVHDLKLGSTEESAAGEDLDAATLKSVASAGLAGEPAVIGAVASLSPRNEKGRSRPAPTFDIPGSPTGILKRFESQGFESQGKWTLKGSTEDCPSPMGEPSLAGSMPIAAIRVPSTTSVMGRPLLSPRSGIRTENTSMSGQPRPGGGRLRSVAGKVRLSKLVVDCTRDSNQQEKTTMRLRNATVLHAQQILEDGNDIGLFVSSIVELLERHEGTVLTIAADFVVGAWNASRASPLHPAKAAQAALEVLRLESFQGMRSGVGVSTGKVLVGLVGKKMRAQVAVGVPKLCAHRLAELCPIVECRALCCGAVHTYASAIPKRVVDVVSLNVGEDRPVLVYDLSEDEIPTDNGYSEGMAALFQADPDTAAGHFASQLRVCPADRQARRLLELSVVFVDFKEVLSDGYCRTWLGWETWEGEAQAEIPDEYQALITEAAAVGAVAVAEGTVPQQKLRPVGSKAHLTDEQVLRRQISAVPSNAGGQAPVALPAQVEDQRGHTWYRSDQPLGKGAFGEVWLGMSAEGAMVAMKSLRLLSKPAGSPGGQNAQAPARNPAEERRRKRQNRQSGSADGGSVTDELLREVSLMTQLRHENIVSYLGSAFVSGYVLIVMEYCSGGSLHGILSRFGILPVPSVKRYMADILAGLQFLHSKSIVHRDLKPHNVLVHIEGIAKLADFGASAELREQCAEEKGVMGTPLYMSPEACKGEVVTASDVWAVGVMLVQLLTGKMPWDVDEATFNPHQFIYQLANDESFRPNVPDTLSDEVRVFADQCVRRHAASRPSVQELQRSRFVIV
eukprot:Hpha_TRINITY_DN16860_c1_g5::TRINITY_DN16860_c1_g5_i1::g.153324::m.153324